MNLEIEDGDILRSTINGYGVLHNRIYSLLIPSQPFHLMDVENGYYLVQFQNRDDSDMALSQGPWIVFRHYLTVQPWTVDFDPQDLFQYGHVRDLCPSDESEKCRDEDKEGIKVVIPEKVKSMAALDPFGPRMFVERKSRRNQSSNGNLTTKSHGKNGGSRFNALSSVQAENSEIRDMVIKSALALKVANRTLTGPLQHTKTRNDADVSGLEQTMQAKDFDGIKAHFNPVFESLIGVGVQLTNDILDPASHSIAMVNLISSQMVNETGNEVQEEAASKLDGVADSRQ
ncbi:hypothetical protein Gorai_016761 [Gossypium raimondii]|uniref:DUF4283 domain-containing protein n=1 Tax=Gossypium raimondii TaxID=29730 RepID=A0A7J8PA33_GOSRA|nr:hypothetical protein [Gossypium raimondii]